MTPFSQITQRMCKVCCVAILLFSLCSSIVEAASYQKIDGTINDPILDIYTNEHQYSGTNLEPWAVISWGPDSDICCADLGFADLEDADLSHATLNGALMFSADLTNANLSYAILSDSGATVSGGSLFIETNLTNANFTGADLGDANFDNANLNNAVFIDADLTNVVSLNESYGTAVYSSRTRLPFDFDPEILGWRLVPEPSSLLLALLGLMLLAGARVQ